MAGAAELEGVLVNEAGAATLRAVVAGRGSGRAIGLCAPGCDPASCPYLQAEAKGPVALGAYKAERKPTRGGFGSTGAGADQRMLVHRDVLRAATGRSGVHVADMLARDLVASGGVE